jgi:hypothetical protein
MPNEQDLLLVKAPRQIPREIDDVVNELPHRHCCIISAGRERLPCSPLIPVDDGEVALQRLCVPPHEREPGRSGTAVNEQDNRICRVLRTNQHPLASFIDWNLLKDSNTIRVSASIDLRGCTWNDEERNRNRYQDSKDEESHRSFISLRRPGGLLPKTSQLTHAWIGRSPAPGRRGSRRPGALGKHL